MAFRQRCSGRAFWTRLPGEQPRRCARYHLATEVGSDPATRWYCFQHADQRLAPSPAVGGPTDEAAT